VSHNERNRTDLAVSHISSESRAVKVPCPEAWPAAEHCGTDSARKHALQFSHHRGSQ